MKHIYKNKGFTLIEFSIVMVLFGILVGSILRGQELITTSKVRNILDQRGSIQTALIAFSDRHQVNAGDLTVAQAAIIDAAMVASGAGGNGFATMGFIGGVVSESATAFQNLAVGRYISCAPCLSVTAGAPNPSPSSSNSPNNVLGNYVAYGFSASSAPLIWWDIAPAASKVVLTTGAGLSPQMLREIDLKGDDGGPGTGNFRLSSVGTIAPFNINECTTNLLGAPNVAVAALATWATTESINCAGAWIVQ